MATTTGATHRPNIRRDCARDGNIRTSTPRMYDVVIHRDGFHAAAQYLRSLQQSEARGMPNAGRYLRNRLCRKSIRLADMTVPEFLQHLVRTKKPRIFAESEVVGIGHWDWTLSELRLLGNVGVGMPVRVYDNGLHSVPTIHREPFDATLLFCPGALLRNDGTIASQKGPTTLPVDWEEVVVRDSRASGGFRLDPEGLYGLYERRLLPLLLYANEKAGEQGKKAIITIPGIGCGQFAGAFQGMLGAELKKVLIRLLQEHASSTTDKDSTVLLPHIRAVYYDPYSECRNERHEIGHISFLTRPLLRNNRHKPQLCRPETYGRDFQGCALYSVVAWDHVSWPGNDFFAGARVTDDGVKAAATDAMYRMTGVEGHYKKRSFAYMPPSPYRWWKQVVETNGLQLNVADRLIVYPRRGDEGVGIDGECG